MFRLKITTSNNNSYRKASIRKVDAFLSLLCIKLALVACVVLVFLFASSHSYAAVKNLTVTVSMDGVGPFDANNNPGNDAGANNRIIRTQDMFEYLVSYDALDTNEVNFTLTLPAGVFWHNSATAASVCNGSVSGGGFLDTTGRVLTCFRKPDSVARESFYVRALPGAIKNGEIFSATIKASDETVLSESLTVSASPKIDLWMLYNNHTKIMNGTTLGVLYTANFEFGAYENASGDLKGVETISPVQTFVLEVGPGSVPYNCSICSQPGGAGTPITITKTINNSLVRFNGNLVGSPGYIGDSKFRGLGLSNIQVFTPLDPYHPIGTTSPLVAKATNWDPLSLSGVSNYGSAYATGYDPSLICPTSGSYISAQRPCMRYLVDRTQSVKLMGTYHGVISATANERLFGDNSDLTNANSIGSESVVPGQAFRAMFGIYNEYTAETPASNAGACVAWDPSLMNLNSVPTVKFKAQSGGNFYGVSHLAYSTLPSNKYILEYAALSFSSDSQRKDYDCGKAGDGAPAWYSNPNSVPGGMAAISNIRYRYLDPLEVNDLIGIILPLMRPTSAESLALGAGNPMPWFQQYYSDQSALVKSNYSGSGVNITGGRVNSIDSFFRHTATLGAASISPGGSTTLTVTPVIIGPVGDGVNTSSNSAKITVTMPNSCLEPLLSSLPTNAIYTAGNPGLDGTPCTADSGETPSKVVLNFGSLTATGGAAGPAPYQGHASFLTPVTISLVAKPNATLQALSFASVASAFNDISPPDGTYSKTVNHSLTISGVASFSVDKTVSGVVNNKVGPNQVFTYSINFGNAGTVATGKARFVDIMPFDGDARGTTGLGEGKLEVVGMSAAMGALSQGSVAMEYTLDPYKSVETAVQNTNNEDAVTGVNWTSYTGSTLPLGVTAVRFTTSSTVNPGYSGFASIQVKAPSIQSSSSVVNNVWGRTEMIGSDVNTVKVQRGMSPVTVQGLDGGSLKGKVYFDLNANGVQDVNELPLVGAKVSLKCISGFCLNASQGTEFSMLTDANGVYSFEPGAVNKIFANLTASGTALANFQGVVGGYWNLVQTPPTGKPYSRVSTTVGSINSNVSGTAGNRTITDIPMESSSAAINYNFGERFEPGKITVTKQLTLPTNTTGTFNFVYTASCDKPSANSKYTATLNNYPNTKSVDILNIPVDSSCVISETLPVAPNGYNWVDSTFTALNPSGLMVPAGVQATTASNSVVSGVSVSKQKIGNPALVSGSANEFDLKYKIEVLNVTAQAVNYSLSDVFSLESDLTMVGLPTIIKSANVSTNLVSGFNGTADAKTIVPNESIDAGSLLNPTIESYEITIRVKVNELTKTNNICNSTAGMGVLGQAVLTVAGVESNASACFDTPTPLGGKIKVQNNMSLPSDISETFNISYKATCDLPTAGSVFTATLNAAPTTSSVDILNVPAGAVCSISQILPIAPSAYVWNTESIGVLTPAIMPIGGDQVITVSNSVSNGLTLTQSIDAPVLVTGSTDLFDVSYHLTVSNNTAAPITYNLNQAFGFDSDIQLQGMPIITKSSNVSLTPQANFNGLSSTTRMITGEPIAAASGSPAIPSIETYDVKARVKIAGFNDANNACTGVASGLFANATLSSGTITRTASACSSTPSVADGKIVIKHDLIYPAGVTGPLTFSLKATCNKPNVNSEYNVQLQHTGNSSKIEIPAIPAGASCTITQVLPTAPLGFIWKAASISALLPSGSMPAGGAQNVTISNSLQAGLTISNEVLGSPVAVAGTSTQYDVNYQIKVSNLTNSAITYQLSDWFTFDENAQLVGLPEVIKSANVSQTIISGFNGSASQKNIINNETINAAVDGIATIQTYLVKLRINLMSVDSVKKTCNGTAGNGLMTTSTIVLGTVSFSSVACTHTPSITPVYFKLKVNWLGGRNGDAVTIPATSGFVMANTTPFKVTNSVEKKATNQVRNKTITNNNLTSLTVGESTPIALAPAESGTLPEPVFDPSVISTDYLVSPYECTDGVLASQKVMPKSTISIPMESKGKVYVCTITNTFIETSTSLLVTPASGTAVAVGDNLDFTLQTTVAGAATLKPIILRHQIDAGISINKIPDGCVFEKQILTCTIPAGAKVGTHLFTFSSQVNELALKNTPRGVKTSLTVDNGSCVNCLSTHGMWEIDTAKTSDAEGKKGVQIGDVIRYTVSVWVKGGITTEDVKITDTRSVGLSVKAVPKECHINGLIINCVLPSGSTVGRHDFVYDATVTKEALEYVSNSVVADQGTCEKGCTTKVKVIREVMLRVTKTALNKRVKIGDFVRYEVLIENLTGPDASDFYIFDKPAPGLSYVDNSLRLQGDSTWELDQTFPLKISKLDLAQNEKIVISYLMKVNAGAGRGELINTAWVDHAEKYVTSNEATASVLRTIDPDFEETRITGVIFNDTNLNGIQDNEERGIPGVRVAMATGALVETDGYGRYHFEGLDPGYQLRGKNVIVKIDESSFPSKFVFTTQNPLVKRLSVGIPAQFNFGVKITP